MNKASFLRVCCAIGLLGAPVAARSDIVSGDGRATVTKDSESVRNLALAGARREIVKAMLTSVIGDDRLGEVPMDKIDRIASQIRPEMISAQNFRREGNQYVASVTADIDVAWFSKLLSGLDIDTSATRADDDQAVIYVYLDQSDGTASDLSKPALVEIAYDRRTGSSFSDKSTVNASQRASSASSRSAASASSASAAGAAQSSSSGAFAAKRAVAVGASGPMGSEAARGVQTSRGGFSEKSAAAFSAKQNSASVSKSASASASASNFAQRNAVAAEEHDDVTYRERRVYQAPPQSVDGERVIQALNGGLRRFGVSTAQAYRSLTDYFMGKVPKWQQLKNDTSFEGYLRKIGQGNAQFFMGGTVTVTQEGIDAQSGSARCSGGLNAEANAVGQDDRGIASGLFSARALGSSPENCRDNLLVKLADSASADLGPQIQTYWRTKLRRSARATSNAAAQVANAQDFRQQANYTLVFRAPKMTMQMQQDVLEAVQSTAGAEFKTFVSQSDYDITMTVSYAGNMPLQFALFQQLKAKPGFSSIVPKVDGRSIMLCVVSCGP